MSNIKLCDQEAQVLFDALAAENAKKGRAIYDGIALLLQGRPDEALTALQDAVRPRIGIRLAKLELVDVPSILQRQAD